MRTHVRAAAIAVLIASAAAPLAAQSRSNPMEFTLAAGAALPTGNFGQGVDVGYTLAVGIGAHQAGSPMGFRVEGMYNEWGLSRASNLKTHAGGGTLNATYDLGTPARGGSGNNLYLIGGLGYFATGGESNVGWNLGGGFRFPLSGFSAYLEARYHSINNVDVTFVPIVFGLSF